MKKSRIRQILNDGGTVSVIKLNFKDPRAVEAWSAAGFDAVWLCREHGSNDRESIEDQIRAARIHGADVIVRVSKGSYSEYIFPLEAGASALMVPHVTSAEEARQIVEWCRFPPLGLRPVDGGNADGMFCQQPLSEYFEESTREQILILQIESPEALAVCEEIAAVPGFDVLCFGAGDYSCRIGRPGEVRSAPVVEARRRVGAAARKYGKHAMALIAPESRADLEAEGYRILSLGADVVAVMDYASSLLSRFRGTGPANARTYEKSE